MVFLKKDKVEPKAFVQNATPQKLPVQQKKGVSFISQDLKIKGDLIGNDDLTVEGTVEGKIEIKSHLVIQSTGTVNAEVFAKKVTVAGKLFGNVQAEELVEIQPTGFLEGNIVSPKITIQEGAHFKGNVDMKSNIIKKEQNP